MTGQGPSNPPGSSSSSRSRGGQQVATPVPSGLIGRYQILDKIGEGGMGSLFLARDPAIDRLVAIKLLRHGLDTEALRERFSREARAAGRLRHLHIVTIFDVGEHEGVPFIAMEFLAGETLAELIREGARLSLSRRLKLLEELCDGLSYAHRAGLVHRDIKPANLMVDADGVLKILDFGIVRVTDSGMTQSGVLVGTVNYMSPEQVVGGAVDHRSDIFAVGLVAYELISGKQAFPGTMKDGLLNKIINVAAVPLTSVVPGIDAEVAAIVEQALQKEPADRYQDLVRMRNDLSRTRVRIEQEEELAASSAAADAGETAIIGEHETAVLEAPRPSTPVMAHDAEHALASGNFRAALTLAGRSAAINPQDRVASSVAARAEAALLDRGRLLESAALNPAPTPSAPSAPAPLPSTVHGGGGNVIWVAVVIAVLALGVAVASLWVRNQPTAMSPVSTEKPASPPQSSPAAAPPSSEARVTPPAPGPAAAASEALPSPPAVDSPGASVRAEGTAAPGSSNPASAPAPTIERGPRVAEPPPVSRTASGRGRRGEPERQPLTAGRAEVPPAAAAAPSSTVAAPPPSPARAAAPLRVGVDASAPQRTHYAPPVYPPDLQAAGAEGTVGLELTIGPDGHVSDVHVVRSARGFDDAAVAAVRQWEFAPRRNGDATVIYPIEVPFKLPEPVRPSAPPASTSKPPAPPPAPPAPSAPPKPADTGRAAPPPADQGEEIKAVLQRYKSAWEALDPQALERVQALSARDADEVRRAMSSANSYKMDLVVQSVSVDPSGRTAIARVVVTRRNNPKIGRPSVVQQASDMHFEKRGDGWMITSIR